MENSPDYIYFKDLDSRFVRCSRSLAQRYGVEPPALIGKTDFDIFTEEHARPAFEDEQAIIRSGHPVVGKIEKEIWKQGEVRWVLTSKMPLRDKNGQIIGTFGTSKDITAMKAAEAQLEQAHRQLLETSRLAGMAEVATTVLHNVGNVLNSVNVSCAVVSDRVRNSRAANLAKAVTLIRQHERDLPAFFASDPKGKQLPDYLGGLAEHLALEQKEVLEELAHLGTNIDHIKEIVAMQQSYAQVSGVREKLRVADLVEDALRMNGAALERHEVKVVREYGETPPVLVDRHKVLQILINLMRNAKYACDEGGRGEKQISLRIWQPDPNTVNIAVGDNGIGIPAENLTRVFEHGFTTRKAGHGFGLHSSALAATDLGGTLTAASDGPHRGATFTLSLPCEAAEFAI
jgi:PAS domain S-box-containing protein